MKLALDRTRLAHGRTLGDWRLSHDLADPDGQLGCQGLAAMDCPQGASERF